MIFLVSGITLAQQCPTISYPTPGSSDVPVDATISWPLVDGITGYSLNLGTTPGGTDILNRRSAGLTNTFTPPVGLPENTRIYVSISMYLTEGNFIFCAQDFYFETENVTTPPGCTTLSEPMAETANVDNEAEIRWNYASRATGYYLTIGTTQGGDEILPRTDIGNRLTYHPPANLPPETDIYVTIVPYNENGSATGCGPEHFKTGSGTIDCGPYIDPVTGETVKLGPEITFPNQVSVCTNDLPTSVSATDQADGYRWFRINIDNTETLLSESAAVELSELGLYRYVAYNEVERNDATYECADSRIFRVVASELPRITGVEQENGPEGTDLMVEVAGAGNYEYALDTRGGPFQESPVFESVPMGVHTLFVRDKNGCGVQEKLISLGLPSDAFPKFFTPNGDGINDYWQFDPAHEYSRIQLQSIYIFDRYGMFLTQIFPGTIGWDGRVSGKLQPASSYWFRARDVFDNEVTGFFALKR